MSEVLHTEALSADVHRQVLLNSFMQARDNYARVNAIHGSRTFHFKQEARASTLAEAEQHYVDSRNAIVGHEVLKASGVQFAEVEKADKQVELVKHYDGSLIKAALNERLVQTGRYEHTIEKDELGVKDV